MFLCPKWRNHATFCMQHNFLIKTREDACLGPLQFSLNYSVQYNSLQKQGKAGI